MANGNNQGTEQKKKKKPSVQDLRRYNAYVKKTMLKGETPLAQDKWMEINAGRK